MLENIIEYVIVTTLGVLVSAAGWLIRRVLKNSTDIDKLIQLAETKEIHRKERSQELQRELQGLQSKVDGLQLMLIQLQKDLALALAPPGNVRATGDKRASR